VDGAIESKVHDGLVTEAVAVRAHGRRQPAVARVRRSAVSDPEVEESGAVEGRLPEVPSATARGV